MNLRDEERWEAARERLEELVTTFRADGPEGGGQDRELRVAVRKELMKLPDKEREDWLARHRSRYRIAVGLDAPPPE